MKNRILISTISRSVLTLALQRMMRATLILLPMFMISAQVFAQEKLEIEGAIIVGNSEDPSPAPGTIRFNGATNDFEGWNGVFWASLSGIQLGSVTDVDGNEYATVFIGSQEWMAENLRTTKYRNGISTIAHITDNTEWSNATFGSWCWYENDNSYEEPYGKLYNWHAVNNPTGLCPTGWHVPTDLEWTTLTDYLGGLDVAGGKMKSTGTNQAGTGYWEDPNTGATNESGFTGLPGGYRSTSGSFLRVGFRGDWWSSTESSSSNAWFRSLFYSNSEVNRDASVKRLGFSVRCVRD